MVARKKKKKRKRKKEERRNKKREERGRKTKEKEETRNKKQERRQKKKEEVQVPTSRSVHESYQFFGPTARKQTRFFSTGPNGSGPIAGLACKIRGPNGWQKTPSPDTSVAVSPDGQGPADGRPKTGKIWPQSPAVWAGPLKWTRRHRQDLATQLPHERAGPRKRSPRDCHNLATAMPAAWAGPRGRPP